MCTLPNFLGIGAQKSGTTWLHYMLVQHPDIYLPQKVKELQYFDKRSNFRKGFEWYLKYFKEKSAEKMIGEITPGYLWVDQRLSGRYKIDEFRFETPQRVKNLLGDEVKLIVVLRHPIRRAVSAYFHHINRKRIRVDESILKVGTGMGIIHMGFYSYNLESWLNHFDKKNFHITLYEDLLKDKQGYIKNIFNFLGVESTFMPKRMNIRYQISSNYFLHEDGSYYLRKDNEEIKAIDVNELGFLEEIYSEEIERLNKVFSIDISCWVN
jgi:hypothetical protein